VPETTRSHLTRLTRQEDALVALVRRGGWQAWATTAAPPRLSLAAAVLGSRHASHIARLFNRLKSRVPRAPLCVARDDHIEGLTSLLTWGVRVCTVLACVLWRSLQDEQAPRPGVHPAHGTKRTDTPTAAPILKAFPGVALRILTTAAGEDMLRWLTPLSVLPQAILPRLGLAVSLYRQLEIQPSRN
jgi:hypothetical protein